MNYYLDVDGTIITSDHQETINLNSFLKQLFATGDVYWLTTHCKEGTLDSVLFHLSQVLSEENFELVKKIKPTNWRTLKTEAIDFSKPFMWFDDNALEFEKNILVKNNCFESLVQINLKENDNDILKASRLDEFIVG